MQYDETTAPTDLYGFTDHELRLMAQKETGLCLAALNDVLRLRETVRNSVNRWDAVDQILKASEPSPLRSAVRQAMNDYSL